MNIDAAKIGFVLPACVYFSDNVFVMFGHPVPLC